MIQHPEHHIQRDILLKLCFAKTLRFSDLKPKNLESNIFMYHLKQLIKFGFVDKQPDGLYTLSPPGLAYVDKMSYTTKHLSVQPKTVSYLQITDANGAQLYWRRNIQPSIGFVGVPVGKIHYGENIQEAAQRDLLEKTGLKGVKLAYRGTANMKFYIQETLVSHILTLVYEGQVKKVKPKLTSGSLGEAFWSNEDKIEKLIPSVGFIIDQLKAHPHGYFFAEQDFYL